MLRIFRRRERGQVIVFAALLAPILLGMTGMAIDIGRVAASRRHTQNAADAAALAGAGKLLKGGTIDQARTAALSWAQKNGYDATKTTVHIPPASGAHTGDGQYVEVSITTTTPTLFIRVLRINSTTEQGRAVAGFKTSPKDYALIVLNKTMCSAYNQSGSSTLNIVGGGAIVNSSCPSAAASQSGTSIAGATYLDYYVAGGWQLNNNATTSVPPSPVSAQVADPLAALPRPVPCSSDNLTPAGCVQQSPDSGGTAANPKIQDGNLTTFRPGAYYGGLKITGYGTINFLPGLYVFAGGGFDFGSTTIGTGSGVTFFNTGDPYAKNNQDQPCKEMVIVGSPALALSAPTSGTYIHILFWQDDTCTVAFKYTGSSRTVAGVIYLPTAQLNVSGGGNLGTIQVIVDSIDLGGNVPITITFANYVPVTPPRLALVE